MSVNKLMKTSTTGGIGNAAYMRVNSEQSDSVYTVRITWIT